MVRLSMWGQVLNCFSQFELSVSLKSALSAFQVDVGDLVVRICKFCNLCVCWCCCFVFQINRYAKGKI